MDQKNSPQAPEIKAIHTELGIPDSYSVQCGLAPCQDCTTLVDAQKDVFDREIKLDGNAFQAWQSMKQAALIDGIELQIVSAFRSIEYQKTLFLSKLAKGLSIEQILRVNAAPGYSEHHTGRAIDIGCPHYPHLEEEFENSPAFSWLGQHAEEYGFSLSFPRNNPYGVCYEPWHWYYRAN